VNKDDFASLKRGLAQVAAYKAGSQEGFVTHAPLDVKAIRAKTKKTQDQFARAYHLPKRTLQEWEQNRRQPDAPARVLLSMIQAEPETVEKLIAKADA
jgi:putative transcriptional regulator